MTLQVVTGAAGTGKTTRLLELMEQELAKTALKNGQRVLALTFMHGSRLRVAGRLSASVARGRFDCVTVDGFAREICSRWRTRIASTGATIPSGDTVNVFDATCDAAAMLLDDLLVVRWVAATHPVIIVDEFQDCRGSRPLLIERLSAVANVFVAADPFQDLSDTESNPAMAMLARLGAQVEELIHVHRTAVPALLGGAVAVRSMKPLVSGSGLVIEGVVSHHVAAAKVCAVIARLKGRPAVLISAGRPTIASFARKVLDAAAATSGYGKSKSLGPYKIPWETAPDVYRDDLVAALDCDEGSSRTAVEIESALPVQNPLARFVSAWLDRQRRLFGRTSFSPAEVRSQVIHAEGAHRALPQRSRGLRALTIHQAKNREFQHVIILWGFAVPGDLEIQRRWLYNAITRARDGVWLFVHDPKKVRLRAAPFV
jgi:hypothetical protein